MPAAVADIGVLRRDDVPAAVDRQLPLLRPLDPYARLIRVQSRRAIRARRQTVEGYRLEPAQIVGPLPSCGTDCACCRAGRGVDTATQWT
jgi:hypothetical protein